MRKRGADALRAISGGGAKLQFIKRRLGSANGLCILLRQAPPKSKVKTGVQRLYGRLIRVATYRK